MKKFEVNTVTETVALGNDTIKFNEMVKLVGGKLKSANGETIIIDNMIMSRLTISPDGTKILFDGEYIGLESAADILAGLPEA